MTEEEFDDRLDRVLRDKLRHTEFEMKPSYWLDARAMIQDERKKKGGFIFFLSMILLAGAGAFVGLALIAGQASLPDRAAAKGSKPRGETAYANTANFKSTSIEAAPGTSRKSVTENAPETIHEKPFSSVPLNKSEPTFSPDIKVGKPSSEPSQTRQDVPDAISSPHIERSDIPAAKMDKTTPMMTEYLPFARLHLPLRKPASLNVQGPEAQPKSCDSCLGPTAQAGPDSIMEPDVNERHFLVAEGGLTYFNTAGTEKNTALFGGLMYHHLLRPGIFLSGGLHYSQLHQNLANLNYEKVSYTFGKNSTRTSIETVRLDYLQLPLYFSARVFRNHYISAGASYGYLLHSSNMVRTQAGSEQSSKVRKDEGYTYAIHRHDVQLQTAYMVMLPKRLMLIARYGFGLTDVSRNNIFRSRTFDRNKGFTLAVGYKLSVK